MDDKIDADDSCLNKYYINPPRNVFRKSLNNIACIKNESSNKSREKYRFPFSLIIDKPSNGCSKKRSGHYIHTNKDDGIDTVFFTQYYIIILCVFQPTHNNINKLVVCFLQ